MATEKIKERIRKLLAVAADNAAANQEIETALRVANQLMMAHHLDESDLSTEPVDQYRDIENAERDKIFVPIGGKIFLWEKWLLSFARNFVGGIGVYIETAKRVWRINGIAQTKNGATIMVRHCCFYGIAEDAQIAADIFTELRQVVITMAQLRFGSCYKGDGGIYCEGFVQGLSAKLNKERDESRTRALSSNSNALILIERQNDLIARKSEVAQKYIKAEGIKIRKGGGSSGASGSEEARREGYADGEAYSVSAERRAKIS